MTVVRQIARLSPVLLLALAVAAVACQQSEAAESTASGLDPLAPATVAQGAEPVNDGLLARWLDRGPTSVRVPAGTDLRIRLLQPLSSEASRKGQGFLAAVAEDLVIGERVTIRAGARVTGTVLDVVLPGDGAGEPRMSLSVDAVELPSGGAAPLDGLTGAGGEGPKLVLPAGTLLTFALESATTVELAFDEPAS